MISSQFNYPTIFDDAKSFRYHQYQVIQDTGVHVYSQPSLLTSPTAIIKQYTTISGTGNIVPSIDDGDNTKFVEVVKNSKYVPISSNVTYRSWPNKMNYLSMLTVSCALRSSSPKYCSGEASESERDLLIK